MSRISMLLALFVVVTAGAQAPDPPLADTRLTIHTLVREDIFAGLLEDNLDRFTRGEKSIETLLKQRPREKASLLAWKGGALLYRAVKAHEGKRGDEFKEKYAQALDHFAQARKLDGADGGAAAVTGGSYVVLADRLPEKERAAGWASAYEAFQTLWKMQAPALEALPVHMRGELLGGLAVSAKRTGRTKELTEYLDKIVAVLPDTPYERVAKSWQANPKAAAETRITCLTCHQPGRLAARRAALGDK